jgi:probable rRNA maturation factor
MSNRIFAAVGEGVVEPDWTEAAVQFMEKAAELLGYDGEEISLLLCNDDYIKELNKTYRNIDAPTDVLSFENDEEYTDEEGSWKCVGDIVISLQTLPVNAEYFEEDQNSELKRLLVHGLLHLNGMDHGEEHIEKGKAPEGEMLILQEQILQKLKDEIIIK